MKMLIFLIVLALVGSIVLWKVRKADAERELARNRDMKLKQKQRKEAITPVEHVKWPVIIKPGGKKPAAEDAELPEPTMSTIEFEPVDHPGLQH